MLLPVEKWERGSRLSVNLSREHGLYALFLKDEAQIPGLAPLAGGLIYLGKSAGKRGIKGRCHFFGRTENHSPRKSLAALLEARLKLEPRLVIKPNSKDTWTLEPKSEERLTNWMLGNLEVASLPLQNPSAVEGQLVRRYAPPLNLNLCAQSTQHKAVSKAREAMMARAVRSAG